jgi:hypothetical protein
MAVLVQLDKVIQVVIVYLEVLVVAAAELVLLAALHQLQMWAQTVVMASHLPLLEVLLPVQVAAALVARPKEMVVLAAAGMAETTVHLLKTVLPTLVEVLVATEQVLGATLVELVVPVLSSSKSPTLILPSSPVVLLLP